MKSIREQRIDEVVKMALLDFWVRVTNEFPNARSGDLSPGATFMLEQAAKIALLEWETANVHDKVITGQCPKCGHYGDDCKGYKPRNWPTNKQMIRAARQDAKEGELEVDDRAIVSRDPKNGNKGAYVQAWLWAYDIDARQLAKEEAKEFDAGLKFSEKHR